MILFLNKTNFSPSYSTSHIHILTTPKCVSPSHLSRIQARDHARAGAVFRSPCSEVGMRDIDKGWILLTSGLHLCWWPGAGFRYTFLYTLGTGGFFIPISTSLSKENLLIALCFQVLVGSCRQTRARILLSTNSCCSHSPSPDFPSVSPHPDIPSLNIPVIILYNVIYKRKLLGFRVAIHMWNRDKRSRMAVSSEEDAYNTYLACRVDWICTQGLI